MNTNHWLPNSINIRGFLNKMVLLSVLIALLLSSFSVTRVFAAGPTPSAKELEQKWDRQLERLLLQGQFYENVRLFPADFEDLDDLEQAHFYLEKFGVALRGAQTILLTRPGFDIEGNVTNELQALRTVRNLAFYLDIMRGMRNKLAEIDRRIARQ